MAGRTAGRCRPARIRHPDLALLSHRPELRYGIREPAEMTVRDDGIRSQQQQQATAIDVWNRMQTGESGHQLGDQKLCRRVDRRAGVLLRRFEGFEEGLARPVSAAVEGDGRPQIVGDGACAVRPAQALQLAGEIVEGFVPTHLNEPASPMDQRVVEPPGIVMKSGQRSALRTRVASRERMLAISANPNHALATGRDANAAGRVADAAEARVLFFLDDVSHDYHDSHGPHDIRRHARAVQSSRTRSHVSPVRAAR